MARYFHYNNANNAHNQSQTILLNSLEKRINSFFEKSEYNNTDEIYLGTELATAIQADSTTPAIQDPQKRQGWYWTNENVGDKMNWYFYSGNNKSYKLSDIKNVYFEAMMGVISSGQSLPFVVIYTKPTGVGDYAVWYKSRLIYTFETQTELIENNLTRFYTGIDLSDTNKRLLELTTINGTGDSSEEVLFISLHTSSSASVGEVELLFEEFGYEIGMMNAKYKLKREESTGEVEVTNEVKVVNGSTLLGVQGSVKVVTQGPTSTDELYVDENGNLKCVINNFPSSQTVSVSNFPASQTIDGSVSVSNFPASQTIDGSVSVSNFPVSQTVEGSVSVSNFPASQTIDGSVSVSNFPALQTVSGEVSVSEITSDTTHDKPITESIQNVKPFGYCQQHNDWHSLRVNPTGKLEVEANIVESETPFSVLCYATPDGGTTQKELTCQGDGTLNVNVSNFPATQNVNISNQTLKIAGYDYDFGVNRDISVESNGTVNISTPSSILVKDETQRSTLNFINTHVGNTATNTSGINASALSINTNLVELKNKYIDVSKYDLRLLREQGKCFSAGSYVNLVNDQHHFVLFNPANSGATGYLYNISMAIFDNGSPYTVAAVRINRITGSNASGTGRNLKLGFGGNSKLKVGHGNISVSNSTEIELHGLSATASSLNIDFQEEYIEIPPGYGISIQPTGVQSAYQMSGGFRWFEIDNA